MQTAPLEADYLVVGAGATAMAFVDTLLSEQANSTVLMVDRHHRPGGHWNDAYPFVRVHQPAAWYGVASRELGSGVKDVVGLNAGSYALASGAEVLAHFDQTMQQRFLPSGRVRFLSMCEVLTGPDGQPQVRSLTSGMVQPVRVRRKVVDATQARTEVPSTHPPKYAVAPGVACVPLNRLPALARPHAAYTVVGSGKTGIDACLWLLEHGVPPERIRWVMPRDAWWMDRANFQPGLENFEHNMGYAIGQFEAMAEATSVPDLFARLEARGALLRIDPKVEPRTYRCAVVSQDELAQLRRIQDIVRLGHLRAVAPTQLVLDQGTLPADADTLYVDCSASAIQPLSGLPVFDGSTIHLFMVRWCQPAFSAALIAYVESHYSDAAEMNALCAVVPSPEQPIDWLRMWSATFTNMARWRQQPALQAWLMQCRLNSGAVMMRGVAPDDEARMALVKASGAKSGPAAARLQALLAQAA
jgi:hypothetical protein